MEDSVKKSLSVRDIIGRLLYFAVFVSNMICIVEFIIRPGSFVGSYQLREAAGGEAAIIGYGVAFAMWNVTYPFFILGKKNRTLGLVIIVQQVTGLLGELYIQMGLNAEQSTLSSSITRFVWFDAGGLVLLIAGFIVIFVLKGKDRQDFVTEK